MYFIHLYISLTLNGMKLNNRSLGQKKRHAKKALAEILLSTIWFLLKWTLFLPFTLCYLLLKKIFKK